MALENVLVYRILTGDTTYPYTGNFTIGVAGKITIDDSNGSGDAIFGDFTHTGGADVPDQNVTASTVTGINIGDTVDLRYKYTYTGSDGSSGTIHFTATNSALNYGSLFVSDTQLTPGVTYRYRRFNTDGAAPYNSLVPCFARGTRIETARGDIAVEDLTVGDSVQTADNGLQVVRWIGRAQVDALHLTMHPKLRPVRIAKGALGEGLPKRMLVVSPQHRILVRSRIAERIFNAEEVLVPAIKMLDLDGVDLDETCDGVEYFHLLFDRHEVIFSEGAATESLFCGPVIMQGLAQAARDEVLALFPELAEVVPKPARPFAQKAAQVSDLIGRHSTHGRDMQPLSAKP